MTPPEQANHGYEDEIDLRDLALMLIEGWRWLLGTLVAVVAAAIGYLLVATPTYSTDLVAAPASDGLRAINAIPGFDYETERVSLEFAQRLGSYDYFSRFLDAEAASEATLLSEAAEGESADELETRQRRFFRDNLSVQRPTEDSMTTRLALNYSGELAGADLLNSYYRWSETQFREKLAERVERTIRATITRNESQMQAHLESYRDDIDARIARLSEGDSIKRAELQDRLAAEKSSLVAEREERVRLLRRAEEIAARLGITQPTTPRELGRQSSDREVVYAEINSQDGLPLYFMGTEALQAEREVIEANLREDAKTPEIRNIEKQIEQLEHNREIEALQAREKNSPFIEAYNELRQENALLRANQVTADDIEVAEVIDWAYQPSRADSPRRALTLALALVLGGMLGVMMVFIVRFAQSLRSYRRA